MAHDIQMGNDGILRITLSGDLNRTEMESYRSDLQPFITASTKQHKLHAILNASQLGKLSSSARRTLTQINGDTRIGQMAILGANRIVRVFTGFMLSATGRNNIDFFDNETAALDWIKQSSMESSMKESQDV